MEYKHNLHKLRTTFVEQLTQYFDILIGTLRANSNHKAPYDDKTAAQLMTIEYLSYQFTSADKDEILEFIDSKNSHWNLNAHETPKL